MKLINNKIYIRHNYNYWKLALRSRARKLIRVFYLHFIYIKYSGLFRRNCLFIIAFIIAQIYYLILKTNGY